MPEDYEGARDQLRKEMRRFLGQKSTSADVRRLIESSDGADDEVWKQLADQLALQGLAIPEQYGGQGFGPVELGIVAEELGRALFVSPFFATVVLAGQALVAAADEEARERWLPRIASGDLTATLAVTETSGGWNLDDVTTRASRVDSGWLLDGVKTFVVDGADAGLVLVVANDEQGPALFAIEPASVGVTTTRMHSLDPTRRLARIDLQSAFATRVSAPGGLGVRQALQHALDLAVVGLVAEQVGGAQRCLDMATDYAKARVQFGRPIGSFQAIKHMCAGMLLEVESARSVAYYAASVADEAGTDLTVAASTAKAYCSAAFTYAAKENIQIHGGIGYTWEHDAHLFLRRAKVSELLFGTPVVHRRQIADLLGI